VKRLLIFISSVEAVAKYCDEHVCVSVGLSVREDISGTTRAIFAKFLVHVTSVRGLVLLQQGDEILREGTILHFYLPRQHSRRRR